MEAKTAPDRFFIQPAGDERTGVQYSPSATVSRFSGPVRTFMSGFSLPL
jgi:hypothetical protein